MSDMIEQTPMVRRFQHTRGQNCFGGVCRNRIEDYRDRGPQPYEFIGPPSTMSHPHDDIPAQIMYTPDERMAPQHLNGFGRITHDSRVDHDTRDSIENYCYGSVCDHAASDNHVRVATVRTSPVRPYYPIQHPPYKMDEVSHVIASDANLQKGVEIDEGTHKTFVNEMKMKDESLLGTKLVVGQHKSLTNLTEEYHGEPEEHVTGKTRGTIEKFIEMREDELHHNPLALRGKEEGTVITFDHTSSGLALKDGRVPQHYGVLDVNPDEMTLKRSMIETTNINKR